MNKQNLYKGLKTFFYLCGWPLMLLMMIITLAPMFNVEVMGDFARNWILIFFAIWAAVEIVRFVLNRTLGKKSETHRKITLAVMAVVSILAVLLPSVICDAVEKPRFESARAELSDGVNVKDYDGAAGWHRDFTTKYNSEVYYLINEHYDFMKMYGLSHTYSEWYDNADKEHNLGYKYGSFEMAAKLVADKRAAKEQLDAAQAELAEKEPLYAAAVEAYAADPSDENKAALDALTADMLRLKGPRLVLPASVRTNVAEALHTLLTDIINNPDAVLPDGLKINLWGLEIDVNQILDLVGGFAGDMLQNLTVDKIAELIPEVIYTGIGDGTVTTLENAVNGSDTDLSLVAAEEINFKINYYPVALAAGAVKYASYICVGLIILSLFLTEYYSKKERDLSKGGENDVE